MFYFGTAVSGISHCCSVSFTNPCKKISKALAGGTADCFFGGVVVEILLCLDVSQLADILGYFRIFALLAFSPIFPHLQVYKLGLLQGASDKNN